MISDIIRNMSLVTELFGPKIVYATLDELKSKILRLPKIWSERKSYLLHDFARIRGLKLKHSDFTDVGARSQTK